MTISSAAAMFGAMLALAVIPDSSTFAVVARSLASGFTHALVTVLGIIVGDFIFILFALFGLWSIAGAMGSLFVLVKYLGGAYLIWLGIGLWRVTSKLADVEAVKEVSWKANFLCGLLITLSDAKAVLFYMSFLPAFVDISRVSLLDTGVLMALVFLVVGGVKGGYAYMADKARLFFQSAEAKNKMNRIAGSVMMGTGIFLIVRA